MKPDGVGKLPSASICFSVATRFGNVITGYGAEKLTSLAQKGEILAFVEVKSRRQSEGFPLEYLSPQQQLRIVKASLQYCATENPDWALQPRYDAAAVVTERGQIVSIEYVEKHSMPVGWMR